MVYGWLVVGQSVGAGLAYGQCDNYIWSWYRWCTDMSRMNLSGYVGHAIIFSRMFTIACCLVVGWGLGLGLGLDLVSGWLVAMLTYLHYFRLSLSHCLCTSAVCDMDSAAAAAVCGLWRYTSVICLCLWQKAKAYNTCRAPQPLLQRRWSCHRPS